MIDSISRRSDSSMPPASAASSARAMISSSVTNGPVFRPLPGRITLATPMSARATSRSDRPTNCTSGAVRMAARSVCWSAQVFGAASATTNTTTTLTTMPMTTPGRAEQAGGEDAGERGLHGLDDVDGQVDRVEVALEVVDDRQHPVGALHALVDQRRGPGAGHAGDRRLGQGEDAGEEDQHDDHDEEPDVGGGHAA